MTKLCTALFVLCAAAACSKSKPANTTTTGGGETTASADDLPDPTLPSWAPRSCKQYHVSVVKLSDCQAVPQEERTAVTAKYDADAKAWHDMTNAQQSDLDRVGTECSQFDAEVKAKLAPCEGGAAAAMR